MARRKAHAPNTARGVVPHGYPSAPPFHPDDWPPVPDRRTDGHARAVSYARANFAALGEHAPGWLAWSAYCSAVRAGLLPDFRPAIAERLRGL